MKRLSEAKRMELERRIPGWGVDLALARRPGVPREAHHFRVTKHEAPPEPQHGARILVHPPDSPPTPVFGTAVPLKRFAPSGWLRRIAYRVPQDKAGHWVTLLVADRVDVWERRLRTLGLFTAAAAGGFALLSASKKPRRRRRRLLGFAR